MTTRLFLSPGPVRAAHSLLRVEQLTLVAGLALVLALTHSYPVSLLPPEFGLYVLQPLLWLGLAAAAIASGPALPSASHASLATAGLAGAFQVSAMLIAGLLLGFSLSPYSQALPVLVLNLLYLGTRLLGLELTRWRLLAGLSTTRPASGLRLFARLASVWLIFWLASLPAGLLSALSETTSAFSLTGRVLLPAASESLLATYLAWVGGPWPALVYRATLCAFGWVSPILPNPTWPVTALLGTLAPLLALLAVHGAQSASWRPLHPSASPGRPLAIPASLSLSCGWLGVALVALALFWFNTGLLGIRPSLVTGSSMYPTIHPGDIAITRTVGPEEIQTGDIIRFRLGPSWVLHRVVEVRREAGSLVFITQGDNNEALDPPVQTSQLDGKLVLLVPRAGKLALELGRLLHPAP